jgi:hypothetical protein
MLDIKINSLLTTMVNLCTYISEMTNNVDYLGLSQKTAQNFFYGHLKTLMPAIYL